MECPDPMTLHESVLLAKMLLGAVCVISFILSVISKIAKEELATQVSLSIFLGFSVAQILFWVAMYIVEGRWL